VSNLADVLKAWKEAALPGTPVERERALVDALETAQQRIDQQQRWIDSAVANCAKRRCTERDKQLQDAEQRIAELEQQSEDNYVQGRKLGLREALEAVLTVERKYRVDAVTWDRCVFAIQALIDAATADPACKSPESTDPNALIAENARLRTALEWFADFHNYEDTVPHNHLPVWSEGIQRAKAALKTVKA